MLQIKYIYVEEIDTPPLGRKYFHYVLEMHDHCKVKLSSFTMHLLVWVLVLRQGLIIQSWLSWNS